LIVAVEMGGGWLNIEIGMYVKEELLKPTNILTSFRTCTLFCLGG
jgi:hypothetical protein